MVTALNSLILLHYSTILELSNNLFGGVIGSWPLFMYRLWLRILVRVFPPKYAV
jgi:hypothetical protein